MRAANDLVLKYARAMPKKFKKKWADNIIPQMNAILTATTAGEKEVDEDDMELGMEVNASLEEHSG